MLARFERLPQSASSGGLARLQAVNRAEVARRGEESLKASQSQSEEERRAALVDAARKGITRISDGLRDAILEAAPIVSVREGSPNGGWALRLGPAELRFAGMRTTGQSPWGQNRGVAFDVIAHASLGVMFPSKRNYGGRGHSLWYCDAQDTDRYRWYETAFMYSPLLRTHSEPFRATSWSRRVIVVNVMA